jgi:hypothetical protein
MALGEMTVSGFRLVLALFRRLNPHDDTHLIKHPDALLPFGGYQLDFSARLLHGNSIQAGV